ncbi:MAG: DUF2842 domain-containing protein [Hyphomicrobium sp.]
MLTLVLIAIVDHNSAPNNAPKRRGAVEAPMTQRKRKLLGTVLLIAWIAVYALLALAVAVVLQINNAGKIVELVYYIAAGLLWVIPAAWLIKWMQSPDR